MDKYVYTQFVSLIENTLKINAKSLILVGIIRGENKRVPNTRK